jgi:hypothetical protein
MLDNGGNIMVVIIAVMLTSIIIFITFNQTSNERKGIEVINILNSSPAKHNS